MIFMKGIYHVLQFIKCYAILDEGTIICKAAKRNQALS